MKSNQMFNEDSSFPYVFVLWMGGSAVASIFFHFKFKRDTRLTEFDKSLWQFQFGSISWLTLLGILIFYLPLTSYPTIQPDDSQEEIVRQLVRNQQEITKAVNDFRDVCWLFLVGTAGYIGSVASIVGKLRKERSKEMTKSDPQMAKPLGLEVDESDQVTFDKKV